MRLLFSRALALLPLRLSKAVAPFYGAGQRRGLNGESVAVQV